MNNNCHYYCPLCNRMLKTNYEYKLHINHMICLHKITNSLKFFYNTNFQDQAQTNTMCQFFSENCFIKDILKIFSTYQNIDPLDFNNENKKYIFDSLNIFTNSKKYDNLYYNLTN